LDVFSGLAVMEIRLSIMDGGWIMLNVEQTELERKKKIVENFGLKNCSEKST
jgi:hypothetical protein